MNQFSLAVLTSLSLLLSACTLGSSPIVCSIPPGTDISVANYSGVAPTAVEGNVLPPEDHATHTFLLDATCPLLQVTVTLEWDEPAEDLDLEILAPDGSPVAGSANFNLLEMQAREIATIGNPAPGRYTVSVRSYANVETPYRVQVSATSGNANSALQATDIRDVAAGPVPRTVVAVIDSGINVYHQFFHAGSPIYPAGSPPSAVTLDVLSEFGISPQCVIELTRTGDYEADFKADVDRGEWLKASVCNVVWFKGTNILAKSFTPGTDIIQPDDEGDTHGTGTSASVLGANPEAIVLFLEGITDGAETFAFNHPAVDFVSTSYGAPGSLPLPGHITDSFKGTYANGKLHFGACDNSPATCVQDGTGGPWWSVGIAGFEESADNEPEPSSGGRQSVSGNVVDFIADFTQTLPYCKECEDGYDNYVGGTSFATPRSAGVASRILLEARRANGHLRGIVIGAGQPAAAPLMTTGPNPFSNWELRRALEVAAWVPEFMDYDPTAAVFEFGPGLPIPPVAPWTVTGWGVLSALPEAGVVERALTHLGVLSGEIPAKDAGFCQYQTAVIESRRAYWDWVNADSQTFLTPPSPDPFIPCG